MAALPPPAPAPEWLRAALHPLHEPPAGPGWNQSELGDLLAPEGVLREAAVLVGLVPHAMGWGVLLTRRTDVLRHHAGQVSFPGGRIEAGDDGAVAAAVRETGEEIGLAPALIDPVGFLDPLCTVTGFRVLPVVAMIDPGYVAEPDPGEVAEVFEAPLEFLLEPANLVALDIEVRGRPRRVLEFVDRGDPRQRIWGATASILLNLRERIGRR